MKYIGWLCLWAGLALQAILALGVWAPTPDALWLATPAVVLLMFFGLLGACAGAVLLYFGHYAAHARTLDEAAQDGPQGASR